MLQSVVWMICFELVTQSVTGQLPPAPKQADGRVFEGPRLVVAKRLIKLGSVLEGDKVTVKWHLENHGTEDLVISRVKPDCGCTVVKLEGGELTIPAEQAADLEVEFDSTRRRGEQTKSITLFTNDPVEAESKLRFTAAIEVLFETKPSTMLNLRVLQREVPSETVLEITPGKGRKSVELLGLDYADNVPLAHEAEPFDGPEGRGVRVRFEATEFAGLGAISTKAQISLSIDGIKRVRSMPLRAEVVGDLTFLPKVVDATRQELRPGRHLPPVTVRSTDKRPFEIISASAGPLFDVASETKGTKGRATKYDVELTVREGAASGPVGTMLEIRTDLLDQPMILVPVFGVIAEPVMVDPPLILLRGDGTPIGTRRRIRVQGSPRDELGILSVACPNPAVTAAVDKEASSRLRHLRFLDVVLTADKLPAGTHETVLTLTTDIKGAERIEIPVVIEIPPER